MLFVWIEVQIPEAEISQPAKSEILPYLEIVEKILLSFKLFVNMETSLIIFINKVVYSE